MTFRNLVLAVGLAFFPITAAMAVPANVVPEPSDLALFAVGVAGLVIGRLGSRSRRHRD